jgi:hypothetical protein
MAEVATGYIDRPKLPLWSARAAVLLAFCIAVALWFASPYRYGGRMRELVPAALEPSMFYRGQGLYPMDVVQFSIGAGATNNIRAGGVSFLNRHAGSGWKPTPLPLKTFRATASDCGGFWCSRSPTAQKAQRWLSRPGSFARVVNDPGDERVLVVNPSEQSVVLGYYVD